MKKYITIACTALMLFGCRQKPDDDVSMVRSLTGKSFTGKKYYFAWGHAGANDPQSMQNEVKYDVLHTHEIFTKELGGTYAGTKLIQPGDEGQIVPQFNQLKSQMTNQDMFIQYSSGHGMPTGLVIGGSHEEIADRILSLPAKEIIIFTMACYSGGLIDTFNRKKAQWSNFESQGRTFYAISSSTVQQTSSTGPGVDAEAVGPEGSAGSAFGNSLWKALIGDADGAYDGVKDGFIELGEIDAFVKQRTKQLGGHDPVSTGAYNPGLIMTQVPKNRSGLSYADRGTDNMSDSQISNMMQATDARGNLTPLFP